jgi:hypothetical protein
MPTTGIPLPAGRGIGPAGASGAAAGAAGGAGSDASGGTAEEAADEAGDEAEGTGVAYAEPPNPGYNVRVQDFGPATQANDGTPATLVTNVATANEGH